MLWILDLDGVVWIGDRPIPGSAEAVAEIRRRGDVVVFLTNNAFLDLAGYVAKLGASGIDAAGEEILTSAGAAASLLPPGRRVLTCAGPGVSEALTQAAVEEIALRDCGGALPEGIDAVLVGFHLDFSYSSLSLGARAVREGAAFIGTNADPTYPTPSGLMAGTGAMLAAFATAAGVEPVVAGKPHPAMVSLVQARFGAPEVDCLVVGDRPATDGAFARRLGVPFALVESGVTAPGAVAAGAVDPLPDLVAPDLATLVQTTGSTSIT